MDFTLNRIQAVLKETGNPHRDVNSLIIGGTNGKGTTSLFLSSALCRAGFSVATYLSPHLQHPGERMLLNLLPIREEELESLAEEFEVISRRFYLTYFEFLTLLFFHWARRRSAEFLVLEVGLGGRLDATNVADSFACAITNISRDHERYLGNTLSEILREKLEIARPESLVFTGIGDLELLQILQQKCLEVDAVYYSAKELSVMQESVSWESQRVLINGYPFEFHQPTIGALENATLAFLMLRILFPKIPVGAIAEAFRSVRNPGRMEIVQTRPRVVLAGAHNEAGISDLVQCVKKLAPSRLRVVCAFSPDKKYRALYESLSPLTSEILLTQVDRLKSQLPSDYFAMGPFEPCASRAVERVLAGAEENDTVLITGSLYLIGEVRSLWRKECAFVENG